MHVEPATQPADVLRKGYRPGCCHVRRSARGLRRIGGTLNRRPRPTLNLHTPAEKLAEPLTNPAAA